MMHAGHEMMHAGHEIMFWLHAVHGGGEPALSDTGPCVYWCAVAPYNAGRRTGRGVLLQQPARRDCGYGRRQQHGRPRTGHARNTDKSPPKTADARVVCAPPGVQSYTMCRHMPPPVRATLTGVTMQSIRRSFVHKLHTNKIRVAIHDHPKNFMTTQNDVS